MFLILSLLEGIRFLLMTVLNLYVWVVIIAALVTWVNPDPYNPIVRTLRLLTEPVLWRIRRALPFLYLQGVDLSPIVLIIGVKFCDIVLSRALTYLIAMLSNPGLL